MVMQEVTKTLIDVPLHYTTLSKVLIEFFRQNEFWRK
jgi:hypothetical protein